MSLFRKEKIVDPQIDYEDPTLQAASATAGTSGSLPATPAGYLIITVNGKQQKIVYYNV